MILFNVISISYIENDVLFFYLELLHKDFFKSDPRAKKNKIKKKKIYSKKEGVWLSARLRICRDQCLEVVDPPHFPRDIRLSLKKVYVPIVSFPRKQTTGTRSKDIDDAIPSPRQPRMVIYDILITTAIQRTNFSRILFCVTYIFSLTPNFASQAS